MSRHFINFLVGVASIWPEPSREYSNNGGGFKRDAKKIQGDFKIVGKDLKKSLKKHESAQAN